MSAVDVDRETLRAAIAAVSRAISDDPARAEGQRCLAIVALAHHVDVVATNRHWLARWRLPVIAGAATPGATLLVPSASVKPLTAWLKARAKSGAVAIDLDARTLTADQTAHVLAAPSADAEFPRYDAIFTIVEAPDPLAAELDQVAVALDEAGGAELAAVVRQARGRIAEPFVFAGAYVAAITAAFGKDGCVWRMRGAPGDVAPCHVRAPRALPGEGFEAVIMPMRP